MKTFLQALIAAILLLTTSGRPSSDEELDKLLQDLSEDELLDSQESEPVYEPRETVYTAEKDDAGLEDFTKYHIPGLTPDGYFHGEKVKSITEIGGQPIKSKTPLKSVLPVTSLKNLKSVTPLKQVSPLKSVQEIKSMEAVKSIQPIKRIEEVKKMTPLKSVKELKSVEEVENMIPIDDEVAERMLRELGLDDENKQAEVPYEEELPYANRRQDKELPYGVEENEPIYEEEIKQSSVGDIQRILALLGISSFDQIKKITPINSIKEVTNMRELNSDEISQLDEIIGKEKDEVAIQEGKLEDYKEKEYQLNKAMAAEIAKVKKIDDLKQIYEIKKMEQIKKIEDIKQMIEIKKIEKVKSIQRIKSMLKIKSKQEIKEPIPIKRIEEVKSMEEVKKLTPILRKYNITDAQAQRIIAAQNAAKNGKYYEGREEPYKYNRRW